MREITETERKAREAKDEIILAMLGKLAIFYWRPDFKPEQAKQLYSDYLDDLNPFALRSIKQAISTYRQDGGNTFFPTSGQLIDIIIGKPEVDARGYTDRYDALQRRRFGAMMEGRAELGRMVAKIEGPVGRLSAPEPAS